MDGLSHADALALATALVGAIGTVFLGFIHFGVKRLFEAIDRLRDDIATIRDVKADRSELRDVWAELSKLRDASVEERRAPFRR